MANDFYGDRLFTSLETTEPDRGMLLVAAPSLGAPVFERAVILLLAYAEDLVFGVDLSRRSDVAVATAVPEWEGVVAAPPVLYVGGPVTLQSVTGLGVTKPGVNMAEHPELTTVTNRLAHVNLHSDPTELAEFLEGLRLFAGCAQWESAEQLDEEIAAGDWYVAPALPGDVIAPARCDLWSEVLRRQPLPLPLFSTFPRNLVDS